MASDLMRMKTSRINEIALPNLYDDDCVTDVAFNQLRTEMALCVTSGLIQVWECTSHVENWILVCQWKDTLGCVKKVVWAHPEIGSVLATCSGDLRIVIWRRKNNKFENIHTIVTSHYPAIDIQFAPIEMGFLIAVGTKDGKMTLYEGSKYDLTKWEIIQQVKCPFSVNKIIWNPSYKKRSIAHVPKSSNLLNDKPSREPRTVKIARPISCLKPDTNLSSLPFQIAPSDQYVIVPHLQMLATLSTEEAASNKNLNIIRYFPPTKMWHILVLDYKLKEPAREISFAPRLGQPYEMFLVLTDEIFIYALFEIINQNFQLRRELHVINKFCKKEELILNANYDLLNPSIFTTGSDQKLRLWSSDENRDMKNKFELSTF